VLPLDDLPTLERFYAGARGTVKASGRRTSQYRSLERATWLEAWHAARGNLDRIPGPGISAAALGALRHQKGAESADGDLPAFPQRVEDAVQERVERALRGDLRSPRRLRHRDDEISLGHAFSYLLETAGQSQDAVKRI